MTHKIKILGAALITILAMGSMTALPAIAGTTNFTTVAGASWDVDIHTDWRIAITGQEVSCEASLGGTAPPVTSFSSMTLGATFSECKTAITNATVTGFGVGGCDFVFYGSGTVDLVCAAGKDVTVDAGPCATHVPAQKGLGTITYTTTTVAGIKAITFHLNISKMKATHTDGFLCPFEGSGTTEAVTMQSTALIRATKPAFVYVNLTDHTG